MYLAYGRKMAECQNLSDPMKFQYMYFFLLQYIDDEKCKMCTIVFLISKTVLFSLISRKKLLEYLLAFQKQGMGQPSSITRNLTREKIATKFEINNICLLFYCIIFAYILCFFKIFHCSLKNHQKW